MNLRIRDITKQDEDWLKALFNKNSYILGGFGPTWYWYWRKKDNKESGWERDKWVCIENIAFAHYLERLDGTKTLHEIAVDDSQKCKGIGKILLQYIGYPMQLKTDANNFESNEFYRKAGYTFVGTKRSKNGKKIFNLWKKEGE